MMISFEGNQSREIVKVIVICFFLILVPAVIMLSYTIVNFNTYQPGRAQQVPTPTTAPWIIIMTVTPVPTSTSPPSACTDTDGINYYELGQIKGSGVGCTAEGIYDSCYILGYVKENYCGSGQECSTVYFKCPYGCSNGACLLSPISATPVIPSVDSPTPSPTTALPVCPRKAQGDADCNGKIDLIDFEIWRLDFIGNIFTLASDFDPNGRVDLIDFEIWRLNFVSGI